MVVGYIILTKGRVMQKEYSEKETRTVGWMAGEVKLLGVHSRGGGVHSRGEVGPGTGRGGAGQSPPPPPMGGVGQSSQVGGAMPIKLLCL